MRHAVLYLLCGTAILVSGSAHCADEPEFGNHELTGPVGVQWENLVGSPEEVVSFYFAWLAVSNDGDSVYFTGPFWQDGDRRSDYLTIAYDSETGRELWRAFFRDADRDDLPRRITVSGDGSSVFVTGDSFQSPSDSDFVTAAYDALTGEELWIARYNGPAGRSSDHPYRIVAAPDGSAVFVSGVSQGEWLVIAYDATSGAELWTHRSDTGWAFAMEISPGGGTLLFNGNEGATACAVALDADTGNELWRAGYDDTTVDSELVYCFDIAIDPNGRTVYYSGTTYLPGEERDVFIFGLDLTTGQEVWRARPDSQLLGVGLCGVSPDGELVYVGGRESLFAFSAISGNEHWSTSTITGGCVLSANGKMIVVSGGRPSSAGHGADYLTAGYSASTGAELWRARYDGAASLDDYSFGFGVRPDATMAYVTGIRYTYDSWVDHHDYATIGYSLALSVNVEVDPARINIQSRGIIRVAVLGAEALDVTDVDATTLRFGPNTAAPTHKARLRDFNHDGFMDWVTLFQTDETGITCGDESANLTGNLLNGQPIEGVSPIKTVGCRPGAVSRPRREPDPVSRPTRPWNPSPLERTE